MKIQRDSLCICSPFLDRLKEKDDHKTIKKGKIFHLVLLLLLQKLGEEKPHEPKVWTEIIQFL